MFIEPSDSGTEFPEANQQAVDAVVGHGPGGTVAVAGISVAIVLAIWLAFYFFVFIPRT